MKRGFRVKLAKAVCGVLVLLSFAAPFSAQTTAKKKSSAKSATAAAGKKSAAGKSKAVSRKHAATAVAGHGRRPVHVAATPQSRRLSSAFAASSQLRPMAQQLVVNRTPAAFNGVAAYAASHPGDGAAAAQLAMGHAYALDRRYVDAQTAFRAAAKGDAALGDYADFLGAQAAVQAGRGGDAIPLLDHFAQRHPDSILSSGVAVLLANAYLQQGNAQGALAALSPAQSTAIASHTDFRLALAKSQQAAGQTVAATDLYRGIYLRDPLSAEAGPARAQLAAMNVPLSPGERKQHADALFNAKQYGLAQSEYRALEKSEEGLTQADKDALEIYSAVCDLRLKNLSAHDVDKLPVTGDDSAALKVYLQSELARNANDFDQHDALLQQMLEKYPHSRWLEEALFSGGNMYLVKRDAVRAIHDYELLVEQFPKSTYAPASHWHAAWLSYRLKRYPDAARYMEEQIAMYPGGTEVPGALYWRGRLYEDVEHDAGQAMNFYTTLHANYVNSYYAVLARVRMAAIGSRALPAPASVLASVRKLDAPVLTADLPENDPHLIKARLLANAALNEYIGPEISASPTSAQWGALAQAEIYQSFGETTRALQSMKKSKLPFFSLPVNQVPAVYWQLLFPRPYWDSMRADAEKNGLDPYLVASLIRQESEFNPGAVSKANAYGLMQLIPSTGKMEARKDGIKGFTTASLLNPITNLELGTLDLKRSLDRYNGQVEYALAAYNAGDTPVHRWISEGDYKDVAEWVESIPYTETREYVQGIMRNRELYHAVYGAS